MLLSAPESKHLIKLRITPSPFIIIHEGFRSFQAVSTSNDEGVWSEWSECSRSCDGGIARRYHCSNANADPCPPSGPLGTSKSQHKICNMHPCHGPMNFRQEKCVQHNDVLHEVRIRKGGKQQTWNDNLNLVYQDQQEKAYRNGMFRFGDLNRIDLATRII